MVLSGSGSTKRKRSLDYPCVRRFRHRRLMTYLSRHHFDDAFKALKHETGKFMSVRHLQRLVEQGLWKDARNYLNCFVPATCMLGLEGRILVRFIALHDTIAAGVARRNLGAPVLSEFDHDGYFDHSTLDLPTAKLRCIYLSLLCSDKLRASLDWARVRLKAAEIVKDLTCKDAQLKRLILLPRCAINPHDVLPIGFGFRPRRHVKKAGQVPASVVARSYQFWKKSLPSSSHSQELASPGHLTFKDKEWLVNMIDECIQAGKPPKPNHPPQFVYNKGAPGGSVSHTMFGTLASPANNYGTPSLTNSGAPVSHTMFGTLKSPAKNSDTISLTKHRLK